MLDHGLPFSESSSISCIQCGFLDSFQIERLKRLYTQSLALYESWRRDSNPKDLETCHSLQSSLLGPYHFSLVKTKVSYFDALVSQGNYHVRK